ncbi:MAG TPA: tRNA (adenosine(37)-N6)-threonylcarbamoyltransferase complex dimerization subunit type 1 TsaB [Frankiaceae bacterium]|nr:tRNA (adenosine(37)-N6)-threonylcarbamoyltransferase complex dimerization subunit type 1 TsaB [Frankiaceae bacterium]
MLVLGIDTSTPATGVAVCDVQTGGAAELAALEVVDPRHSAEALAPLITRALDACSRTPGDLDAIVAGLGPGPYTSLRVGIVTAAALGDALAIPVYGVCSLDGFGGVSGSASGRVTVVTDARRREVYWARYENGVRIEGPDVSAPQFVADALEPGERVIGGGGELYAAVFGASYDPEGRRHPDPANLIRHAVPQLGTPAAPLVPLYQRRPDATPRTAA